MAERILLVACDERTERLIREKAQTNGSAVLAVVGVQDVAAALRSFRPTTILVDDKKLGPHQVWDVLQAEGVGDIEVSVLSQKGNEYGAVLGIGCFDAITGWAFDGCLYGLGCLGLALLGGLITLLVRWLT